MKQVNIGKLLTHRASTIPNHEAIVDLSKRYSFAELNQRVNQLAHWLRQQDVRPKDRVAYLIKNSTESAILLLASAKIGAIATPLNWLMEVDDLYTILFESQPKVFFYQEPFANRISRLKEIDSISRFICLDSDAFKSIFSENLPADEPEIGAWKHDPAVLLYSFNLAGKLRGIMFSHQALYEQAISIITELDWRISDRSLIFNPMFHIAGIGVAVTNLLKGATSVFLPDFHPEMIWDIVEKEKITHFLAPPHILLLLLEVQNWFHKDLDSLRFIITFGYELTEELINAFDSFGIGICKLNGSFEYPTFVSSTTPLGREKPLTEGKLLHNVEAKIVDLVHRKELSPGEFGELVVKGPHGCLGYWNHPEDTAELIQDGWYYTHILGTIDEEGFIFFVDRYRDVFHYQNQILYPSEFEIIIRQFPGIRDVAVLGVPEEDHKEIPVAFVVKQENSIITEEEILKKLENFPSPYCYLKKVIFVEQIQRDPSGKILKEKLIQSCPLT